MRPLTERWPKPLLPVDGRPVLATLLRELVAARFERAVVVTGHLAEHIERFVGDGRGFGLVVECVRQAHPHGSADAVARALEGGAEPPLIVLGADTRFQPGDIARFRTAFEAGGADGAIAVRRDPPPDPPHRFAVRVEAGAVTRVLDDDPANPCAGAPLWGLGASATPFLEGLSGPPFELAEAFQRAIDAGLRVSGVEIGSTRDLTHPEDLMHQNFPYLRA
jgi:NDP-sugar pyrophosphorylase family protein